MQPSRLFKSIITTFESYNYQHVQPEHIVWVSDNQNTIPFTAVVGRGLKILTFLKDLYSYVDPNDINKLTC